MAEKDYGGGIIMKEKHDVDLVDLLVAGIIC